MIITSKRRFLEYYHIGEHTLNALLDEGLPCRKVKNLSPGLAYVYSFDTDKVDDWLKKNGIELKGKHGIGRRVMQKYISVDQAKKLFPNNPCMALVYALFCTVEDYAKMFRKNVDNT